MTDRDLAHLRHARDAITEIREWDQQHGREAFFHDRHHQAAMLRRLQTLTESATLLSDEVKSRHTHIDWSGIAGFRNIVVHDYLADLRPDRVYAAVENDLESLLLVIEEELARAELSD